MRRFPSGLPLLLILGVGTLSAFGLFIYFLSGLVIFGGRLASDYNRPTEPVCNDWYRNEVFRPSAAVKIPSCEESLQKPRRTEMLETEEGLRVRLVIPDSPEAPAIWLHLHGITDSYLNGMRFTDLAQRQGFQLILLELQNHGGSDRHSQGSSWGCREKYDLFAAMDYVRKTWPDKPVLLTGTSMGTLTITQAVLSRPEAFTAVRGIIYESPLSSLENISDRICARSTSDICPFVLKTLIPFFTPLRTNTDFNTCFHKPWPPTEIPTELWLSRDEFPNAEQLALGAWMPAHKNVEQQVFDHGSHSAYYAYEPEAVEKALQSFWLKVQNVTPPRPPAPNDTVP